MLIIKNIGVFLIISGIMLFTVENVSAHVETFKNERQEVLSIKNTLNDDYEEFIDNTKEYKELLIQIAPFYEQYYEDMETTSNYYTRILKSLEVKKNDLNNVKNNIQKKCNKEISDSNIEQRCKMVADNYKEIETSFQTVYEEYNEVIEEYNDYYETENHKQLEKYELASYN